MCYLNGTVSGASGRRPSIDRESKEDNMADTVRKVEYFSLQISDKPGEAFKVLSTLVSAGINLLA